MKLAKGWFSHNNYTRAQAYLYGAVLKMKSGVSLFQRKTSDIYIWATLQTEIPAGLFNSVTKANQFYEFC